MIKRLWLIFFVIGILRISAACIAGELKFVILICSYNNENYVKRNVVSAIEQKYDKFRIIYVDDASTDHTYDNLIDLLNRGNATHLVKVIRNNHRKGTPLANQYYVIHEEIQDDEIVVLLDGDDYLAHDYVLAYLDRIYRQSNKEIWMTFGQFRGIQSGDIGFCCEYPATVIQNHTFRQFVHFPSHLKTFYAWLFKKIQKEDLLYGPDFYKMTGDLALALPLIEMAKNHHKFISEVLYLYNEGNPISDHKLDWEYQMQMAKHIRSLNPYQSLD